MKGFITVNIENIPTVLHGMRAEFARRVREAAEAEADPRVTRRLLQIAADFEAGQ